MSFAAADDDREQGSDRFPSAAENCDRSCQSLTSIFPLVLVLFVVSSVSQLSKLLLVGGFEGVIVIALLAAAACCRRNSFSCLYSEYFSCTVFAILPIKIHKKLPEYLVTEILEILA